MDNLTHSLIGATIGELTYVAVSQRAREAGSQAASVAPVTSSLSSSTLRYLLIWIGVIASNFPDIDVIYTGITPAPLGALLHHRGHTHTLVGCVFGLFICLLAMFAWPKFRALMLKDRKALQLASAVALLGLTLHITADALNSYGVHPFYPFSTRWIYGDMIFIVEPFWWVVLGVPLLLRARPRWVWLPLLGLMTAITGFAGYTGYLNTGSLAMLAVVEVGMLMLMRKLGQTRALQIGAFLALAYIGVQGVAASNVRATLTAKYTQPNVHLIDVVLSPLPSNPQCWSGLVLMIDEPTQVYAVVRETAMAFSALGSAETCPLARPAEVQGRLALKDLRTLMQTDCWFAAWMQFVRVPMVEDDKTAVDLRFSNIVRRNFTTLPLVHPQECPRFIPGWSLPRADLLQ